MLSNINLRKIYKRQLPYFLQKNAPNNLKTVWQKTLPSSRSHLVYFLFSISIWKIMFLFQRTFYWFTSKNSTHRKTHLKLLRLSLFDQIPIQYFHFFDFEKQENWNQRHLYLYHKSFVHVLNLLNSDSGKEAELLNDKHQFFNFCQQEHIPTPKVFGTISQKKITWYQNISQTPQSFIIKPFNGSKGKGFNRFLYDSKNKTYNSASGEQYSTNEIFKIVIEESDKRNDDFIIQECLDNHYAIGKICNNALATIRILSIKTIQNEILFFRPILQLPQGKNLLNYFHKGNDAYIINLESGIVESKLLRKNEIETKSINLKIPFWQEAKNSLLHLHKKLENTTLIGWDVAITNDGYFVLEGNLHPSLDIHQKSPYTPFINSKFYKIVISKLMDIQNHKS